MRGSPAEAFLVCSATPSRDRTAKAGVGTARLEHASIIRTILLLTVSGQYERPTYGRWWKDGWRQERTARRYGTMIGTMDEGLTDGRDTSDRPRYAWMLTPSPTVRAAHRPGRRTRPRHPQHQPPTLCPRPARRSHLARRLFCWVVGG